MIIDRKGTMGGNPDVLGIARLRIAHHLIKVGNLLKAGNPELHPFNCIWHLLQVANTEKDVFLLLLTKWLNFGSSFNTLRRGIIRTGFAQSMQIITNDFYKYSRIDFSANIHQWFLQILTNKYMPIITDSFLQIFTNWFLWFQLLGM